MTLLMTVIDSFISGTEYDANGSFLMIHSEMVASLQSALLEDPSKKGGGMFYICKNNVSIIL